MLHLLLLLTATSVLACDPVQNLAIVSVRSTQVQVSWSVSTAKPPDCIKGYKICTSPSSCTTVLDAEINEYSVTGLNSCKSYNIAVVTLDANNVTSVPAVVVVSTAPGPLSGLGYGRIDNDTISVMWNYDQTAGSSCAAQFQLSMCDASGANCADTNIPVNRTKIHYSQDLPRKPSCNAYVLNMAVLDSSNQMSDVFRANGTPDLKDAPEDLKVTNLTSSSFDIGWVIPDAWVNCHYFVNVYIESIVHGAGNGYGIHYDGGVTKHSQTNLTSCTKFNISVHFKATENGNGATTTVYTLPEVEKVFDGAEVQELSSSSVLVAWNTSLPIDQCIAAYAVCWAKQSATGMDCRNATSDKNSHNITGLTANTKYRVSVFALLHTGVRYDNVTLEASTKSGAARILGNSLLGISTTCLTLCLLIILV